MVNYTEILRLASEGRSQRQIAASVRSSRNTVSEVIIAAQTHGITWPFEEAVSNEQLGAILFPNRHAEVDWLKKHKIAKCQPYALNHLA